MSQISDVRDSLNVALKTVQGLRVYSDLGESMDPPAAIVGPPRLNWEAQCPGPTSARFLVYVVVGADERALENLWRWVELAADALDGVLDATVIRADPGTFNSGGNDLPSYEITVEVSL